MALLPSGEGWDRGVKERAFRGVVTLRSGLVSCSFEICRGVFSLVITLPMMLDDLALF
jgi:hypothetical protein